MKEICERRENRMKLIRITIITLFLGLVLAGCGTTQPTQTPPQGNYVTQPSNSNNNNSNKDIKQSKASTQPINQQNNSPDRFVKQSGPITLGVQWLGADKDTKMYLYSALVGDKTTFRPNSPDGIVDGHLKITVTTKDEAKLNRIDILGNHFEDTLMWGWPYYGSMVSETALISSNNTAEIVGRTLKPDTKYEWDLYLTGKPMVGFSNVVKDFSFKGKRLNIKVTIPTSNGNNNIIGTIVIP